MKLEELVKDEGMKAELKKARSLAEVVETLKAYGVMTTEKELEQAYMAWQEDELDEAKLESVAGGWIGIGPLLPVLIYITVPIFGRGKR